MLPAFAPIVAVPARNEAERLPKLLRALDSQQAWTSKTTPLPVVIVLNNTTDQSAKVIQALAPTLTNVELLLTEVDFEPAEAHVGSARRLAMETAATRIGTNGVILTTDADAVPSPDWVRQNLLAIENGADIVGGRISGDVQEEAVLGSGFQRRAGLYARYSALCDELAATIDPVAHDPWPRHQDHTGGSLAVRADVYCAVGGLPALPFREDVGFVSSVVRSGYRLVHPMAVNVTVSARTEGRAPGGMADCVKAWVEDERAGKPILVEAPELVERRFVLRHAIRSQRNETAEAIAQMLEEQAASDLDVVGTVPIEQAIAQVADRIVSLKGARDAA